MSKDHSPTGFNRPSGYSSDLENSETSGTRVNTSFGSNNHNAYIHHDGGVHEHYWYDLSTGVSDYHGESVETNNNHPR